jgi:hypothetical protein
VINCSKYYHNYCYYQHHHHHYHHYHHHHQHYYYHHYYHHIRYELLFYPYDAVHASQDAHSHRGMQTY